ncbi:MAG: hypothetical protein IPJ65_33635 [Archangiaceae bacterium]|nr:hypothetical protein [Archangiaceae bacterium]
MSGPLPERSARLLAFALLVVHGAALAAWAVMMPWGFTPAHPRFWVNEALPVLALLAAVVGGVAVLREWRGAERVVLSCVAGAWFGAAVTSRLVFPVSAGWGAVACAVLSLVALVLMRRPLALVAMVAGAFVVHAERGADPDTRPLNVAVPASAGPASAVYVTCGTLQLRVDPNLELVSTSPDRCWTIFSAWSGEPEQPQRVLEISRDAGATALTAYATLAHEQYSHLNHFTEIQISGHRDLRVRFPSGFTMPVEPSDYPVGRPTRFAYLGADELLHVVQASSAEKGPFTELDRAPLPGGALELVLLDGAQPQCRVVLETFAAQASRQRSPTAGWGVPENAIELLRASDDPRSAAVIFLSLAATSIGRGWDSVGHRAGTYVNRLRVEPF